MPNLADQMLYSTRLQPMTDDQFLAEWHQADMANDDGKLGVIESAATHRYGMAGWMDRYISQFPSQTRYQRPTR